MKEEQIRQLVEKRLGRRLPECVWQDLCEWGWVRDVQNAWNDADKQECLSTLIKRARAHLRLHEARPAPATVHTEHSSGEDALPVSALLALDASLDAHLESFRKRYLPNGLIRPEDVPQWLQEHYRPDWQRVQEVGGGTQQRMLGSYAVARVEEKVFVPQGGECLYELWLLTERFTRCGWTQEQAVLFVLCGIIPVVGVHTTVLVGYIPTITLRVPVWVHPMRVKEIYRRTRRQYWSIRFRPFTRRQAEAVYRICEHWLKHPTATWQQVAEAVGVPKPLLQQWWTRARQKVARLFNPTKLA